MTSDVGAAREFYNALFGWELTDTGPDGGGYLIAELRGRAVAGIGPMMQGQEGHPPVWTTYLASADVDATAEQVTANGGVVLAPPFDVMDIGRMAIVQDPTGATFGVWQAGTHIGAMIANEPGTLTWNELMTRDYDRAKAFYAAVFGYSYTELGDGGFQYSTIDLDGRAVGGIGTLAPEVPREVPTHWRVYFAVDNPDEVLTMAASLGGRILRDAEDMPYGRWGDASDGQGAMFSVIKPALVPEQPQ
jgi:predicted enzyme related to lactoylglutathione lyase